MDASFFSVTIKKNIAGAVIIKTSRMRSMCGSIKHKVCIICLISKITETQENNFLARQFDLMF